MLLGTGGLILIGNLQKVIETLALTEPLLNGAMGIEVEEHRLKSDGHLSDHPYPEAFGSRRFHPTLQSDFGESQMELITIPKKTEQQALTYLNILQTVVHQYLRPDETIWPLSMPPFLSTQDKRFISQHFGRPYFQAYRNYLEKVYGIEQELITGIHINFSVPEQIFQQLHTHLAPAQDYITFKNELYFRVAQNMALHRWLITYLFGAAPISENTYWRLPNDLRTPVRSIRSSSYGYSNKANIKIGYQSLHQQIHKIDQYVADQTFFSTHEFYGPVRVKAAEKLAVLEKEGIRYLEMRMFDLNPFEKDLVGLDRLRFVRLMALYSFCIQPPEDMEQAYDLANQRNESVALGHPEQRPDWLYDTAMTFLEKLDQFVIDLKLPAFYRPILQRAMTHVQEPGLTVGARVTRAITNGRLIDFGLAQGQKHRQAYATTDQQPLSILAGQCSTAQQWVIRQAVIHGFQVDWDNLNVYISYQENHQVFKSGAIHSSRDADQWLKAKFGKIAL